MKKQIGILFIFLFTITTIIWFIHSKSDPLISALANGQKSPELFTLPTGINEFDLLYKDGFYHLFYDDKAQTRYRRASTINGLSKAKDELQFPGNYPSILYENGAWHLWVWDNSKKVTKHYSAKSAKGQYTFIDECPHDLADYDVAKSPVDGYYYAGYKKDLQEKVFT